jgi:undecaprenyl diphosphate synthase
LFLETERLEIPTAGFPLTQALLTHLPMPNSSSCDVQVHIPRHVAIIMDGNGRWARKRGLARIKGHEKGGENVLAILESVQKLGIRYLTLYAFSVENWKRPADEVAALMLLLEAYINRYFDELVKRRVRLRVIGNINVLPDHARVPLERAIHETARFTGQTLVLALNYGARSEVLEAARSYANDVATGHASTDELSWDKFSRYLYTRDMPDPDLIIRTSGETRLSNFLLLQAAYAEWYFTSVLWPDFDEVQLLKAITEFSLRERRFGRTGEQIASQSDAT